ncbi:MAG: hypothetical protein K9F97_00765 [Candidatus Nanopelagicales bacterium]|nr:hypothetical protein [Candidatus Nanopelagicales bacterium]
MSIPSPQEQNISDQFLPGVLPNSAPLFSPPDAFITQIITDTGSVKRLELQGSVTK